MCVPSESKYSEAHPKSMNLQRWTLSLLLLGCPQTTLHVLMSLCNTPAWCMTYMRSISCTPILNTAIGLPFIFSTLSIYSPNCGITMKECSLTVLSQYFTYGTSPSILTLPLNKTSGNEVRYDLRLGVPWMYLYILFIAFISLSK